MEEEGELSPAALVGSRMREAREALKLSQKQLGERLQPYLGLEWAPQAVSAGEQGKRRFNAAELLALSFVLRRPISWFLTPDWPGGRIRMPGGRLVAVEEMVGTQIPSDTLASALSLQNQTSWLAQQLLALVDGMAEAEGLAASLLTAMQEAAWPARTVEGGKEDGLDH